MPQIIDMPQIESQYEQLAISLLPLTAHLYEARRHRFPHETNEILFFDSVMTLGHLFLEQKAKENPSLDLYLHYAKLVGERVFLGTQEQSKIPSDKLESLVAMADEYKPQLQDQANIQNVQEKLCQTIQADPVLLQVYDLHWTYLAMKMIETVKRR